MTTREHGRKYGARPVLALLGTAHPIPSLAVTGLATAVAAATGRSVLGCLLVAATVLSGQLSIGWGNDLLDRERDVRARRRDKPLATGTVQPAAVTACCAVAVACCLPLSLANGWRAGVVHLVGVGGGWAYNLGLKRTIASFVPYAMSFALLAAFLTLGLPGSPWPAPWALAAGALLGVGAHFLNVVPDIDADLASGIRGLPQRLGAVASSVVGAGCLAVAAALVVLGPAGDVPGWAGAGLAATVAAAALAALAGLRRRADRLPFLLAMTTAAGAVALLVGRGSDLT